MNLLWEVLRLQPFWAKILMTKEENEKNYLTTFGSSYSRMDQVKSVKDSL